MKLLKASIIVMTVWMGIALVAFFTGLIAYITIGAWSDAINCGISTLGFATIFILSIWLCRFIYSDEAFSEEK